MRAKTDRRHVQGDASRERILDATIEIASLRGYHGTSIAEVSKRSGLPASSIYWHFANKDDLIAAVIQRSFDTWLELAMQVGVRRIGTAPAEQLVASMRLQAAALVRSPEFLRLGLMLALERHPKEPAARALFLRVRGQALCALEQSFERVLVELSGSANAVLAHRLAMVSMAAADGLFVAYQVDPDSLHLEDEFQLLAEMIGDRLVRAAGGTRADPPSIL
jgi:AcrR family transcriptional regulator